jgi:hypothetical protein
MARQGGKCGNGSEKVLAVLAFLRAFERTRGCPPSLWFMSSVSRRCSRHRQIIKQMIATMDHNNQIIRFSIHG